MPYVAVDDRKILDPLVDSLAQEIADELPKQNNDAKLSTLYKGRFIELSLAIKDLINGKKIKGNINIQKLAQAIYDLDRRYNYSAAFNGELNYSITRLIQLVPKKLVEKGIWKEEFRYWIYSQTAGALTRTAMEMDKLGSKRLSKDEDWLYDGLSGVFEDIKDEYKRRVNTAYEAVQIKKSGDCYDTPYHTDVIDIKDTSGNVIGWQETMKDLRKTK